MKNKIFSLFALSVFALVLLVSGVSAVITLNPISHTETVYQGDASSFTFTIFNDGGTGNQAVQNITVVSSDLISGLNTLPLSQVSITNIPVSVAPNSTSSAITITINIPLTQATGLYNGTITVDGIHNDTLTTIAEKTISLSLNITAPSEIIESNNIANHGDLKVKRIDFTNNGLSSDRTFGEDDQWFPFEEIETKIIIENIGNFDVSDIELSWGLWSVSDNDWVIDFDKEDEFNLDKGDENTAIVNFKIDDDMDLDLDELTDGENYRLYVVATGTIDDSESTNDGEETSVNNFEPVSIIIENDFVILDNFQVPESVQCSERVTLTADVWNVGDDQDEVSVRVYNKELGISRDIAVGDMNAFDRVSLNFDMTVPNNAAEKTYLLTFTVYDEDGEVYQASNDDEAIFSVPLAVKGSCVYATATTTFVDVELTSGGKAGQPLVLTATISNLGDKTADYTFKLNGYTSWASLSDVVPANLTLAAGETQEVAITLDVNNDVSGEKTFNFETYSNGYLVTKQPLAATITSGFSFASITGGAIGSATPLIIGLLSVILVVIILIVLVKVAKK